MFESMNKERILKAVLLSAFILLFTSSNLMAQKPSNREEVKIKTNLDCDACKKKIEDYMAFERGVTAIHADIPTKVVTIGYRTKRTDEEKLLTALRKLGYEAEVMEEKDTETSEGKEE
jgi:periplasmic mercuric ion binding protein